MTHMTRSGIVRPPSTPNVCFHDMRDGARETQSKMAAFSDHPACHSLDGSNIYYPEESNSVQCSVDRKQIL